MQGDWVNTSRGIAKVYECRRKYFQDEWGGCYFDDEIEDIEVTEEMLLKIGFEKHEGIAPKTFYRYWDKEYRYKLDADDVYCNSERKWNIHLDNGDCETIGSGEFTYVHELQNLVRVITGHDLPIGKDVFEEFLKLSRIINKDLYDSQRMER